MKTSRIRQHYEPDIKAICSDCGDPGPHEVLDDEGDFVVVQCWNCDVEFEVEL